MRHVAFVIPTLDRMGGAEQQVMMLACGLAGRSCRVSVLTLSGSGGKRKEALLRAGAEFLSLEMRKGIVDPRGWLRLRRWLRAQQPDVLHAHLPHATWVARWIRLRTPVRVVVDTIHTSATGTIGRRLGYQWSSWLSDQSTAVSSEVARAYLEADMVSQSRLTIIPNGVNAERWRPDGSVRAEMRRAQGVTTEFLWLAVGRLEPVKDYATLLRAFAELPSHALLAIAGEGSERAQLEAQAEELGVGVRVRFLGFIENTVPWMQAADGYVLTSRWEGLPMGLLEASACSLPIVATDVAGTRGLITHEHTGLLVEASNAPAVADTMRRAMAMSTAERAARGASARILVQERYDIRTVLNRWEDFYDELLDQNPAPRRYGRAPRIALPGTPKIPGGIL
jgi:glycosyltransferase involved in cell wall biosynthesis